MFRKILVANRGEIAIRAFRAATEVDGDVEEAGVLDRGAGDEPHPHEHRDLQQQHRPDGSPRSIIRSAIRLSPATSSQAAVTAFAATLRPSGRRSDISTGWASPSGRPR